MELSANRRYTSKLVLEDITTVFQKTKVERSGKNKRICKTKRGKKVVGPTGRATLSGWPWDHRSPGCLEAPCHMHLDPYKCLSGSHTTYPWRGSALLGPWVSRWVLGAVWWLVNYTLQQRNWCGPGGPKNSRHGWEAEWRLRRNFNCTTGNTAITAIVIGKTLMHRFT